MNTRSQAPTSRERALELGQRLYCRRCHFAIEITNPSTRKASDQVFRCCDEPMQVTTEVAVHFDEGT
jgi:hypothetical protein